MIIKASQEEASAMQFTAIKAVKQARIGVFSIACIKGRFFSHGCCCSHLMYP